MIATTTHTSNSNNEIRLKTPNQLHHYGGERERGREGRKEAFKHLLYLLLIPECFMLSELEISVSKIL